jgi:ABC-type lipoprotein export system ATPase subunit
MSEALLEACRLEKHYDGGRIHALRGLDLAIGAGEFLAVMGASGSGKSTLLHLLGGLDAPSAGEVRYRSEALPVGEALDEYRARRVGFVFQAFHLLPTLRAMENVEIPMFESGATPKERREKVMKLLHETGMEDRAGQYPNELSGGERQRVAIARSLANDPEILLADEPTGNLDSENAVKILDMIERIRQQRGMTLVMVTHEEEIARRAGRCVRLRDGRI